MLVPTRRVSPFNKFKNGVAHDDPWDFMYGPLTELFIKK
jgi:hypothetical protein